MRSQRSAVRTPPGNASLAVNILKISHEQHPKVAARRNRVPTHVGRIVRLAQFLHERVKTTLIEQPIQFLIKHVTRHVRQRCCGHPQCLLLFSFPASHAHNAKSLSPASKNSANHNATITHLSNGIFQRAARAPSTQMIDRSSES